MLLIAYGNPAEFETLHIFLSAAQAVVPEFDGPAKDEPLLEFQVADPDVLRQRLINAGLSDVTVDTSHQERITMRTGQQLWDWCLGGNPIPACSSRISPTSNAQTSSRYSTAWSASDPAATARPC